MNILFVPDSFKGSLSSLEAARLMEEAFAKELPHSQRRSIPIADGGEGSVEAFLLALGGEKITYTVQDPIGRPIQAFYGMAPGDVAIVEMAASSGLPLLKEKAPMEASTYGAGQLMLHALEHGAKKILLGLGGSATSDGGAGAAAALGVKFYDADGDSFVPTGGTLSRIAKVDLTSLSPLLAQCELIALCDIDNPLLGERGAARVFSPQKGATPAQVELLEAGLRHFSHFLPEQSRTLLGGGAAGGFGAGAHGLLGARLQSGMDTLFSVSALEESIAWADIIVTGEGRLDAQSLAGKAPLAIARRAAPLGKTLIALVGGREGELQTFYEEGFTAVFSITSGVCTIEEAMENAKANLQSTARNVARIMKKWSEK